MCSLLSALFAGFPDICQRGAGCGRGAPAPGGRASAPDGGQADRDGRRTGGRAGRGRAMPGMRLTRSPRARGDLRDPRVRRGCRASRETANGGGGGARAGGGRARGAGQGGRPA